MKDVVSICMYCSNQQTEGLFEERNLFKSYVNVISCFVRGDPDEHLNFANSLHENLQCTLEKFNME